jgi:hypothetical protein
MLPRTETRRREQSKNVLYEQTHSQDFAQSAGRNRMTVAAPPGHHAPARNSCTAKSYRWGERQERSRCAGDIRCLTGAITARKPPAHLTGKRRIFPVRTDVVCLACAVNTCGNDSPACHTTRCRCAASAKPYWLLLGKRDTARRRRSLPINAAVDKCFATAAKRSFAPPRGCPGDHSLRRAVFVHQGFCRPRLSPIQSQL